MTFIRFIQELLDASVCAGPVLFCCGVFFCVCVWGGSVSTARKVLLKLSSEYFTLCSLWKPEPKTGSRGCVLYQITIYRPSEQDNLHRILRPQIVTLGTEVNIEGPCIAPRGEHCVRNGPTPATSTHPLTQTAYV